MRVPWGATSISPAPVVPALRSPVPLSCVFFPSTCLSLYQGALGEMVFVWGGWARVFFFSLPFFLFFLKLSVLYDLECKASNA